MENTSDIIINKGKPDEFSISFNDRTYEKLKNVDDLNLAVHCIFEEIRETHRANTEDYVKQIEAANKTGANWIQSTINSIGDQVIKYKSKFTKNTIW